MSRSKLLACLISSFLLVGVSAATAATAATARVSAPASGQAGSADLFKQGKKKGKTKKGKKAKSPLTGRYFWKFSPLRVDESSYPVGLYFASPKLAYYGTPEGGLPRCKKASPKREDGELVSGCVPYKLKKKGKLKVEKLKGTYRKGTLKLDGDAYYNTTIPKPGSKYNTVLISRGFWGLCGLILGCTTWREDIAMNTKGEFVRSSSSISTVGGSGGGPFVWSANYPPDETGTYKILSKGRLKLSYEDGSTKVHTMAIDHDDRNKPDIVNEGMVLDDVWFYREDEDED